MLIYEKDNKLNISFENNMEETDIKIGKDEVKIGEATISENNVLPVPEEGDTGKVPVVQSNGSYALDNVGGGSEPLVVTFSGTTAGGDAACDKTWEEIVNAYNSGREISVKYINVDKTVSTYSLNLLMSTAADGLKVIEGNCVRAMKNVDEFIIISSIRCRISALELTCYYEV